MRKYETSSKCKGCQKIVEARAAEDVASSGHFLFEDGAFYRSIKQEALAYFTKESGGRYNIGAPKGSWLACGWAIFLGAALVYLTYLMNTTGSLVVAAVLGLARHLNIVGPTHASSHFALFVSPLANRAMLAFMMIFNGESPLQWLTKHVVAHHVSTNITPTDDDTMWPIKRSNPTLPRLWFHRFQTAYMWIVYPATLALWAISHTIKVIIAGVTNTPLYEGDTRVVFWSTWDRVETVGVLAAYWSWRAATFIYLPLSTAVAVTVVCEIFASVPFAVQFAVNHERLSPMRFAVGADPALKKVDWGAHQTLTSANYCVPSWFWLHASGGLNTQVEHHLFPSVCYTHYRELSQIVQKEAARRKVHYEAVPTFEAAVKDHWELLHILGEQDQLPTATAA
jgi:fatty acid desaturase